MHHLSLTGSQILFVGILAYNYLDDIICLSGSHDQGVEDHLYVIGLLRRLGFYIAWHKLTSPLRWCIYLGVQIDTLEMVIRLPDSKIEKIRAELRFWENRRKATRKHMQRLVG